MNISIHIPEFVIATLAYGLGLIAVVIFIVGVVGSFYDGN